MKIELKSREGSVYKKLCSSVSEANSDAELIVPDSLEDILRKQPCHAFVQFRLRCRNRYCGRSECLMSRDIGNGSAYSRYSRAYI